MTHSPEQIRSLVLKLLSDLAPEMDPKQLQPDVALREQIDIDSIDFLKFITQLYETLGINIPESDYKRLDTLDHIVSYLVEKQPH